MRLKGKPAELSDSIVSRHRSAEGYKKISAALKIPKSTVASIILKWKMLGMPGHTELLGRGALV
uniref:Sleeping Beauty transposase HTH domain-containing protein n=1 Tax=Seriola lalandi dorsalis TaxID=1841481 RepID=A0A3B4X7D0_SERLL